MKLVLLIALLIFAAACSTQEYRFVPTGTPGPQGHEREDEAFYPIPPAGNLRVRSLGLVDLKEKNADKRIPALHLRMMISNQSKDETWSAGVEEQSVSFANHGQERPLFANSGSKTLPKIEVRPGELRTADLYFPLPAGMKKPGDVPAFDFHWTLAKGAGETIDQTTAFTRVPVERPANNVVYPYEPWGVGFGPMWWYGPPPPARPPTGRVVVP